MENRGIKVFVVMQSDSTFLGVFSSKEKAQEMMDRVSWKEPLQIEEEYMDDFTIFNRLSDVEMIENRLEFTFR